MLPKIRPSIPATAKHSRSESSPPTRDPVVDFETISCQMTDGPSALTDQRGGLEAFSGLKVGSAFWEPLGAGVAGSVSILC